ncbi:hypothetical protein ASPWEDRAFT_143147 [Aspergillus wentii DTO 134E9]|uniref:Mediator of RNA polymerase II transcription subunit 13 n=1 Tax=Aspergillus wentii DTO 134E9 TaxID=1073089 RepID=A0A1L9R6P6_ASPWE|nr:uncharacterized protein ASPWEDRAFT_143147 [Aspergillus wentii DTO 134E9]KAI9926758.1 mediator of RNA polymerase II transcription subunit 13 [Aspergillus wentii]OJJ30579.1 hypothetical protein ASPWEDRAFT_143147 [Aspergillus wentii DTO 134E9]
MDFPGGNITNIRVIDGFSNIYWRIYTEEPGITNYSAETPANGFTILKHLSRLKDIELRLRNLDCLASCYPRRLGLWVFSATPNFEGLSPLCLNESKDDSSRLLIGSTTLKVSASGNTTSQDLVRTLSAEPQPPNGGAAGPQRAQNAPNSSRRTDGYANFAAIHASFISAVTGAISLQLIRRHNAIPLGSRTLFTAIEIDGYESPKIINDSPASISSLTTVQIQLTSVGKLTVSLQTIAQAGIARLYSPRNQPAEIADAQSGMDLWLSPNGTIARLVNSNTNLQNSSPFPSGMWGTSSEGSLGTSATKRKQWKLNVLEWLGNSGLQVNSIEDEPWVEVEVWEPFYARLSGEILRQNEQNPSVLPLKRILWPARYCFKRTRSPTARHTNETQDFCPFADDPLEFAEKWYVMAIPGDEASFKPQIGHEEPPKGQEMSPFRIDPPDGIESLSRIAHYPDLQTASLVYPTPPDGAVAVGPNSINPTDVFAEDPDSGLSQVQNQVKQNIHDQVSSKHRPGSDLTMDFGPAAGLVVGSGLYDTNDDDDLFGEMNDKDFGSKGITDADFSFFDDPGFDMGGDTLAGDIQEAPSIAVDLEEPRAQSTADADNELPEIPMEEIPAEPVDEIPASPKDLATNLDDKQIASDSNDHGPSPQNENSQTMSPPLSPVEVKKILFSGSNENDPSVKEARKHSHYNPVNFQQNIGNWNQKYGAEGKFWFSGTEKSGAANSTNSTSDIPTIGLPQRSVKAKAMAESSSGTNSHETPSSGLKQSLHSDSDSNSDSSDDSDEIISEGGLSPIPAASATLKRKRAGSNSETSHALSPARPPIDAGQDINTSKLEDSTFLGNFLSTFSDWSLTGYFSASQAQIMPVLVRKDEYIQIAQLLVDQVTQSSLNHKLDGQVGLSDLETEAFSLRTFLEDTDFIGEIERLDLKGYVSLQDMSPSPPASDGTISRQTPQRKETTKGSISRLSAPHLRIRRDKDYLEALPPAIAFWETFGLEPAHGNKNISAYCIHPHPAADAADAFLERLGLLYSSCNLGKHIRGDRSKLFERGLASWNTKSSGISGYPSVMQSLRILCEELGTAFLRSPPSKDNLVIYIINPFTHAAALADICSAFWQLFQRYVADADKTQAQQLDEIVLQVIPLGFVMSSESIVVPSQSEYLSLALEVYSRCPPDGSGASLVNCAPPVLLAEPLPRSINFKLASERLSPLQEARCLHVACSRSLDQRWITVAWSDNTGSLQRTMSYCLRFRNSNASRNVLEMRGEIWSATKSILDKIQARWRVVIVNTEPIDQEEVDTWMNLAEQYNKTRPVPLELTMLNVNTTPDLYLEPPLMPMPMSVFNQQVSSTPVATPNPSVASPDQSAATPTGSGAPANAPTPIDYPFEAETESLLTDVYDESWGVVLSHRLNSSPHLTEYRPALASGYLLRRKGPTDGDGVLPMNVNLIYTQRPSSSHESLLREILGMYRGLSTLARARGTRNVQRNTLPWHIATAIRAQELLSYVL